jgi:hypothetical protein
MRFQLAAALVVALGATTTVSTQSAPAITSFTINNGVADTASDQVTLRFGYTNPAAPGQPIAHYRIRYKSPTQGDWFAFGQWQTGPTGTPTLQMVLARNGITPIPGEHRYQLQIRDVKGQMSATAEAVIRRTGAATAPTPTASPAPVLIQTYRVTGGQVAELVRVAKQRGFRITVLPVNTNSDCWLEDSANDAKFMMNAKAPLQLQPVPQCRFRVFEAQRLQPNWHLKSVAFDDGVSLARSRWVMEQPLKPSGQDASFVVYGQLTMPERVVPSPLSWLCCAEHRMTELVLEGPVNKTWRNAFEP